MKKRGMRNVKIEMIDGSEWPQPVKEVGVLPASLSLGYEAAAPPPGEVIAWFQPSWTHMTDLDGSERLWVYIDGVRTEVQPDSPEWQAWAAARVAEREEWEEE